VPTLKHPAPALRQEEMQWILPLTLFLLIAEKYNNEQEYMHDYFISFTHGNLLCGSLSVYVAEH
jgi:hypothetical protein